MGAYKGTNKHEPGDIETAYFEPSWHDDFVIDQSLAIAALSENQTSIIFSKLYKNEPHHFVHFIFTEEETDMLISALFEVKKRWAEGIVLKEEE